MQKDKGKGEPIGSDICATTRASCLEKLRAKMELLTHVSLSSSSQKSASMKRRKAKVTEETLTYTETRSVMDLRMGFLSMQYGVLLRWDTTTTGKVILVVLRKMCHESFYRKDCLRRSKLSNINYSSSRNVECHDGNHVVSMKPDGTEVTLLGEPYKVERPLAQAPALLDLKVVRLEDFSERSTWTIQVAMGSSEAQKSRCQLRHGVIQPILADKSLSFELPDEQVHIHLTVEIYEQKRPRQKRKRLISQQLLSLNLLDVSRHSSLVIPKYGTIVFSVLFQSSYIHWLQSELQARRSTKLVESNSIFYPVYMEEEEHDDGLWELCCVF
jgi:hypothetical protein